MNENGGKAIKEMKEYIILDNGSTLSLFGNPKLIEGIQESKTTLELATNTGTKCSNQEADMPGFGRVWYDQDAITNIFGFADLVKKYRITYDSDKEDTFLVHMPNKTIKFERSPEGLYQYKMPEEYKRTLKKCEGQSHLVATVQEN